jgi:pimeloyl-ACP methyl ester carboxylesterase
VLCELVRTQTADGVRIDGAFFAAERANPQSAEPQSAEPQSAEPQSAEPQSAEPQSAELGQRTLIFLHGAGSNFYGGAIGETLSQILPPLGWSVLLANTRGHDLVHTASQAGRGVRLGAAYEMISDSARDCAAWVDFAESRGGSRVVLGGHSLGAIKAVYATATDPSLDLAGLLAISPPRLSRSAFQYGPQSSDFLATLAEATGLIDEGNGEQLIESPFPFPMLITCRTFVDKYGGETYNVLEHLPAIECPALFVFGERELTGGGVAFAGLDRAVAQRTKNENLQVSVVAKADHFYQGVRAELGKLSSTWLVSTLGVDLPTGSKGVGD